VDSSEAKGTRRVGRCREDMDSSQDPGSSGYTPHNREGEVDLGVCFTGFILYFAGVLGLMCVHCSACNDLWLDYTLFILLIRLIYGRELKYIIIT